MRISTTGLVLLGILISSIGVGPAFAATNSTNGTSSTNTANSTMAMNSSMAVKPNMTSSSSPPTPTAPSSTSGNQSSQSNFPLPAYMYTNASSGHSGPIVSMGTSAPAVAVSTDKTSYNDGDKITISGSTRDYLGDTPLTLEIRNPVGNLIDTAQITVSNDKTFSTTLTATGLLWQAAGTYSVYAQFGGPDRSATTTFQFAGSHATGPGNTIMVDGTNSSLTYTITNGKVLDVKADANSKSLIVTIQTTGDGVLTITMPRAVIDAKKTDGTDDTYFVLNDGQENDQFQETHTTTTDRTIQIPFTDGTSQIEIIGTFVVPEFGVIAALVLAVAIISIIAISAKTGLRFHPRM